MRKGEDEISRIGGAAFEKEAINDATENPLFHLSGRFGSFGEGIAVRGSFDSVYNI